MNTADTDIEELSEGLIACHSCDALADTSSLQHGETAKCSYCGGYLTRYKNDWLSRVIAYSITSLILLALASSYPFLSFKAAGLESEMTLPQAAWQLYLNDMPELALLVAGFIMLIPALALLLTLYVSLMLVVKGNNPIIIPMTRLLFMLQHWCMVDVFLIGVIVSLVKLAAMATLVMGLSFWAYETFTIGFTLAISNFDRAQSWQLIEKTVGLHSRHKK